LKSSHQELEQLQKNEIKDLKQQLEASLKQTNASLKQTDEVLQNLNINQSESKSSPGSPIEEQNQSNDKQEGLILNEKQ
jgi:RNA polymerase-binding transcription factor DksA